MHFIQHEKITANTYFAFTYKLMIDFDPICCSQLLYTV